MFDPKLYYIPMALLLFAIIPDMPYQYYVSLKIVVSIAAGASIYYGWKRYKDKDLAAGAILIFYNPFLPIRMSYEWWSTLDLLVIFYFYLRMQAMADDIKQQQYRDEHNNRFDQK